MLFSLSAVSLEQYLPIIIFFAISVALSLVIMILPQMLSPKVENSSKLTSYECGFEPFENVKGRFNVKFYLVAMLFIIFDLEIAFLVPWAISLKSIGAFGYYSMMFFLFILSIGLIYEYKKGALEW
jgi:NADH-quinone oxidoreductase subunit A